MNVQPKERPILFNGEMVRAILDGRKTMTRRAVKPKKCRTFGVELSPCELAGEINNGDFTNSPWLVGDRLWVRETCRAEELPDGLDGVRYLADNTFIPIQPNTKSSIDWLKLFTYKKSSGATVPSIFMPRWASRITLEITAIHIERLQDITHEDAKSEGVETTYFPSFASNPFPCWKGYGKGKAYLDTALDSFKSLWQSINGDESWSANPWVWVVEFKVMEVKPERISYR